MSNNDQQQEQYYIEPACDLIQEEAYFGEYDRAIAAAALSADYYDSNYDYYCEEGFAEQEDEDVMELDPEDDGDGDGDNQQDDVMMTYDYEQDSLLNLIVGVQSYLSDMASAGFSRDDSPLLDLQYKMYTYLKQRACDMGVDAESLY